MHHIYAWLIFDKGAKTIQWWEEQSFQQMVLDDWIAPCKE